MNLETIITLVIVAATALFVAWRLWRMVSRRQGACGSCAGACGTHVNKEKGSGTSPWPTP
jgi:hypothetical protein